MRENPFLCGAINQEVSSFVSLDLRLVRFDMTDLLDHPSSVGVFSGQETHFSVVAVLSGVGANLLSYERFRFTRRSNCDF